MSHKDSGWRPKGADHEYKGHSVSDHGVFPNEVHTGDVDPDETKIRDDEDEEDDE